MPKDRDWRRWRAWAAANLPQPCGRCGETIEPGEAFHVGHIIARSAGGTSTPGNLRIEHPRCNLSEAPRLAWQAKQRRGALAAQATAQRWGGPANYGTGLPEAVERSRVF